MEHVRTTYVQDVVQESKSISLFCFLFSFTEIPNSQVTYKRRRRPLSKAFSMSSLITAVFKATIGLLVNKGRDKLAEKLNEGDVTDQKFRGLIVREIDEIKSKLDGLARKDLLASISLFKEGIELLYEVFESARPSSEHRAVEATATACVEQFDIAKEMRKLQLTALDESATRKLSTAKETFGEARLEAIKAFSNEALELPDRLLAMQYRLMATILRTIDNPTDALAACRVCLAELHQVPAVKECFKVELERGLRLRALFKKDERRQIIYSVCHANRVIHDVMQMCGIRNLWTLPVVDTGKEKVDPLRDGRVIDALMKQGLENCCLQWSFGLVKGQGKPDKLKWPIDISINAKQQFLMVAVDPDLQTYTVEVFDSNGKFVFNFKPKSEDADATVIIWSVATSDMEDNIYLLVNVELKGKKNEKSEVQVFNKAAELQHKFPVRRVWLWPNRLRVTRKKVLMLSSSVVDVHELSGKFVCRFGEELHIHRPDITATCDGRVMIVDTQDSCVHLFTEEGQQLAKFNISTHAPFADYFIAHHPVGDHVVVAYKRRDHLELALYTVKGELVRMIQLDEGVWSVHGITVSMEGHIAVAFVRKMNGEVVVVV